MSKWIHTTLNDICRSDKGAIISGPFGSNISSKFFVLDGVPVIRGNNLSLSLDKFYDDDFVFVTEEKADELNCYAEEGDLIFTAAGTIGQVGILEAPLKYKKYVISNKQLRARIDTRKVDLLYAYYWFASAWMQNYFIRNNKGSTVPLITLSELKDAPISYPEDITEQKKIAMAIEAISRKINNNRNICFNLESMAKTLYDYWFTQFDFPNAEGKPYRSSGGEMVWNDQLKREIPKGWDTATINEMTKSCRGVSYDKNDLLPSPENGVLVLRGNNIQNNRLVYDNNVAYVPHSLVAKEQQISAHDIILIEQIINDILKLENGLNTTNTIIVGDFNINPYDNSCVNARYFHGIPIYEDAMRESRNIAGKEFRMFYNPMWNFLGDFKEPYGTYYRSAADTFNPYWHIYDQVIIRPSLRSRFVDGNLKIITGSANVSLLDKNKHPNHSISDHLPITFEIKEDYHEQNT